MSISAYSFKPAPANAVVFHAAADFDASAIAQVQQGVRRRLLRRFVRLDVLPADDAPAIIPDRVYRFDETFAGQGFRRASEGRQEGILSIVFDIAPLYFNCEVLFQKIFTRGTEADARKRG